MRAFNYTALGDSLTVGIGAYLSAGFVERFAKMLERTIAFPVLTEKYAKNGLTSQELVTMIQSYEITNKLPFSDVITISIGGNDLIAANKAFTQTSDPHYFVEALEQFQRNVSFIKEHIEAVQSVQRHSKAQIRFIGLYNPYRNLPHSDYWVQQFNSVLQSMSSPTVQIVTIYPAFKQYGSKVLSFGGIHPNGKGHQLIANELMRSLS
ncbi:GDSL-type esterase/lipase family protein [Alkalihalobacterium bogoriense]|uniref:GDSL-type esterase/lipase family protein n=1 Tax=Alkalihalobacterium bogoriense TaxID=246272 RepID=UPI00047A1A45|nr:GDSL-type esterase/lipase family protein [Alkalihalobacterium bogoriense]